MKKRKIGEIIFIFIVLTTIFFVDTVSAKIEPKPTRVIITGEENLSSLLTYSDSNSEEILTKEGEICYLHKSLYIFEKATFRFEGKDCPELRMYAGTYIRIAGTAYFHDIKVTSADKNTKLPIQISRATHKQSRPHIYTDYPADYIHIENSEFSYLGSYNPNGGSTWGVSFWHLKSGYVNNSIFHHNYFGIYTWDAKDVVIENSLFHNNIEYGMDFHDYSDNFIVRNNKVFSNGNHGIIFSKWCNNNKIFGNQVYDHIQPVFVKGKTYNYGIHGIMLHKESNNNIISGNILENNDRAIVIFESHNNLIEDNVVVSDRRDGLYLDRSTNNLIKNNVILETGGYGLYSYHSDKNEFTGNYFEKGTYFKDAVKGQEYAFESTNSYLPLNGIILEEESERKKIGSDLRNSYSKSKLVLRNNNPAVNQEQDRIKHTKVNVDTRGGINMISFGEFIYFKMYHVIAITAIAILIFLLEILYKGIQQKKKKKSNIE